MNPSKIRARLTTVTTAGIAVQLETEYPVPDGIAVMIKASPGNSGNVFIGGTQTEAQTSGQRYTLKPNETVELQITNLNLIWVDTATSGDGVEYILET